MATHIKSGPDGWPSPGSFAEEPTQRRKEPKITDVWQDALAKQNHFDACKAAVEDLRGQLDAVCSDIVEHGNNGEKVYQARMLEVSLRHARRQLELAHQQLDASIRLLRRVHAGQRSGGDPGQALRSGGNA
jgi:hypothetical protein